MGRREITGVLAGLMLLAGLAGCSSTDSGPSDAQIDSAAVPAAVEPTNGHSDTGGCALITPAQVGGATGASIERTSNVGLGCAWSGSVAGGEAELVVSLEQAGDENGDGARVFAELLATHKALGSVQQVPGVGQQAFGSATSAPTVWWLQDQQVYSVAVELAPPSADALDTAIELATIASGNLRS